MLRFWETYIFQNSLPKITDIKDLIFSKKCFPPPFNSSTKILTERQSMNDWYAVQKISCNISDIPLDFWLSASLWKLLRQQACDLRPKTVHRAGVSGKRMKQFSWDFSRDGIIEFARVPSKNSVNREHANWSHSWETMPLSKVRIRSGSYEVLSGKLVVYYSNKSISTRSNVFTRTRKSSVR